MAYVKDNTRSQKKKQEERWDMHTMESRDLVILGAKNKEEPVTE